MSNKTLLVGAEGYIGSNCPFETDKIDLKTNQDFLEWLPRSYDTIIFLAARLNNNISDFNYNERLYQKLDEWLELYPKTHVIYASSAAVYSDTPISHKENEYPKPIALYGESKLAGEYRVREYMNHTALRFGNVYGKMNGQTGHGVTELFQRGQKTIFGDGKQVRDFVHVSRIWQVIELARKFPEIWQGITNVSMARPVTINDWFNIHGKGTPRYAKPRVGDIQVSILDNSKMLNRMALCE